MKLEIAKVEYYVYLTEYIESQYSFHKFNLVL